MKYLILLVVIFLSIPASAFEDILYDFNTRTQSSNIYAFKGGENSPTPNNVNSPSTQVSNSAYTALKFNDQTYQQSDSAANGAYPVTRFVIFIDEVAADITNFTVLWNGYGININNGRQDGANLYLWNFRLAQAELVSESNSTENEVTLTVSIANNITDYFGGTNQNGLVLYAISKDKQTGQDDSVNTDYVSLTVTVPEPAVAIANFQFDECTYSGTGNEVIDQFGNYSGTSHNSVNTSDDAQIEKSLAISNSAHHMQTNIPLPARYSVSTWFKKPTDTTGNRYFVLGAMIDGSDLLVIDRDNDWRWAIYSANPQQVINGTYSFKNLDNNWHHMALVYKNGQSNLYIDGQFIEAIDLLPSGTLKYIGTSFDDVSSNNPQGFRAPLDEFIVFNGALKADEVTTIYNNQLSGNNYDGTTRTSVNCIELIAQYSLDESFWSSNVGEVLDGASSLHGQAFNGANTALNSPALAGNPGTCAFGVFDGVDDYVKVANDAALNIDERLSITAWINPQTLPNSGFHTILSKDENYEFHLLPSGEILWWWDTDSFSTSGAGIVPGNWYHIAITYQSGQQVIYVNGIAKGTNSFTGVLPLNNDPLHIGQDQNQEHGSESRYFDGLIDEVNIYQGTLSNTDVNDIYNARHPCAEPIIHHYEIVHDGNGLTCAPESITIKACSNSDCTIETTESVSLNFNITSANTGKTLKASPTFSGSTLINLSHTTPEVLVLSIDDASIAASNAVECSGFGTSCNITFTDAGFRFLYGDANSQLIDYQTAGQVFTEPLKLQAVKNNNGACEGIFSGNVNVSLAQQNITPDTSYNAGLAFQSNGVSIAKHPLFTDNITLNFGSDSIATIPAPQYLDVGKIRLHASYSNANISLVGSSNDFWVKPASFVISASNVNGSLNGNNAASAITHVAGENFDFSVSALNANGNLAQNYRQSDGQLQLKLSRTLPLLNGSVDGNFTYAAGQSRSTSSAANFSDASITSFGVGEKGKSVFSGAQYNEVGVVNIDIQDINYGGLGSVNGLISANDITVGRFIPAYFKQTVKAEHKGKLDAYHGATGLCAIADWAYSGQRTSDGKGVISYSIEPKITISAYNANGALTKNYTLGNSEGFMKLAQSGVDITVPTHDDIQQIVGSSGGDPVAIAAVMELGSLSASVDVSGNIVAGEWLYTFSSNDHFSYLHNDTSLLPPFNANIPFVTNQITDSDGVVLATSADATEKVVTDGVEIRFARMVLNSSYGSENAKLRAPLEVQVYKTSGFTINQDESCLTTAIGVKQSGAKYSGNMSLWDYRLVDIDTDAIEVSDTNASVSGGFNAGKQSSLEFSPPGKQGTLEWEYEVPDWLKFKWDAIDTDNDANYYDDNPSSILSFGVYRGNDRIISWREVTN